MPPERLPWDRKDNYKERKYERSVPRWRETTSFSSSSSGHYRDFSRWSGGSNEFRRPPPGHGKQGGWNLFPEEPGHGGYVPFRSGERILEDKNFRPSISRGDSKYGRSSRDNRGSFGSQRDWRSHPSWEMSNGSPNTTGRFHDVGNDQRSAEDMVGYSSPLPRTEFANNRYQLPLKDSHNNNNNNNNNSNNNNNNISSSSNNDIDNNNSSSSNNGPNNKMAGVIGLATGQRGDREDSLDWKLVKWTRPGSLSSRGSGFGHSTSSKSLGVADFIEGKAELQIKNSPLVHSPSGDATTCVTSSPSEDTTARKKQRLNWGEGLAKYEKKKVEGPEVNVNEGVVTSSNAEPNHSQSSNLVDKSPRVLGLSECASPATPSSVAFSSPGIEEKTCGKGMNAENDVSILCGSPCMGSHTHVEDISFNLEVLDATSIANLGSSLVELLQYDDSNSLDSNFARSTVMNKLHILKGDISKALEVTESEIDSLETELKSLKFASESRSPCPASSSSFPLVGGAKLDCEQGAVSNNIAGPSALQVSCSGAEHMEKIPCCNGGVMGDIHGGIKDDDVDSPGTATSKFVEPMLMEKAVSSFDVVKPLECSDDVGITPIPTTVLQTFVPCPKQQDVSVPTFQDYSSPSEAKEGSCFSSDVSFAEDNLCSSILAANKESANRASEVFDSLLPRDPCAVVSNVVQWQNASLVKERFAMRKRFLRFKEKVATLKLKAFRHLWKEDMRLQSLRKYRAKSQKRCDMSLWTTHTGQQKNRSSIRFRFSSPVGNLSLVPTSEMLNGMKQLLSISQVSVHRNALKMPALILDKKERMGSRFISSNGLIEDPWAVEKERAMINPWTAEEREIFIDKLATFGKDFQKIASFFDHKTTADCVEFYYKNHKSDCFEKTKKCKQTKSSANYLMSSGKTMNRAMNAASLDILGAASLMAAGTGDDMGNQHISSGRMYLAGYCDSKKLNVGNGNLDHLGNFDILESEKETVAADVLAGICGSMSSEAVSSCITTSVDPGEGCREWKSQRLNYVKNQPSTSDVTQNIDEDTCSDESCGEMDLADWTDEEKSLFIQAVSSYGKDFAMISRCVSTRSRDQCKVFFSKARKCLGLDSMHLTSGNAGTPMSDDTNGGGSDTEDGCAVEICSTICNDKVDAKVVEHLPLGVMEAKLEETNTIERKSSGINMDICENGNVAGLSNQNDSIVEKVCASDASQMECKSELAFADDGNVVNPIVHQSGFSEAQEISNESVSSEAEREKPVEGCRPVDNAVGAGPSNRVVFEVKARPKVYIDCNGDQLQGEPSLHGNRLHSQMLDAGDSRAVSHLPSDVGSSSNYCIGGENLHQVSLEFSSVEKSHIISLQQESELATNAGMHDSAMIECEKMHDKDRQPSEPSGVDNHFLQFPGQCLVNCTKTYQKRETNEDTLCRSGSEMQRIVTLERNGASQFVAQDCSLRKCNTTKAQCSVHELPLLAQHTEQVNGHSRDHSWCSSDVEKPLKNGDVKLFGKILSNSSSHESTPGVHENVETGAQSATVSNKSSSTLKFTSHQASDKGTSVLKFDHANYSGLENVPVKSYGFWDGNKIQTGFSSLPPEYFLAKYPTAFSNYQMSSSKIEQQAFPAALKCTDRVSALPPRETSGSNGVMDYQIYRSHDSSREKTFAVEAKQRPDKFASEMQRLNGFEAISSLQQQGRGTVGLNVVGRGGIVVGGVSDPVAALKMHYAKTEQCGGQTIMSEDEPTTANLEKQKG